MSRLDSSTPLRLLLKAVADATPRASDISRLVRNVEQSMRVEGYAVSENDVRSSAARILGVDSRVRR